MALSPEEKRRRQAIDRDPANKCQWPSGCGNTARRDENYCGAHLAQLERDEQKQSEFADLRRDIKLLPLPSPAKAVLELIVYKLEALELGNA